MVEDEEVIGAATVLDPDEDLALGKVKVTYMESGFGKVSNFFVNKIYNIFLNISIYFAVNNALCCLHDVFVQLIESFTLRTIAHVWICHTSVVWCIH